MNLAVTKKWLHSIYNIFSCEMFCYESYFVDDSASVDLL